MEENDRERDRIKFFFIWLLIDDAKEGFFFFLVTGERERKC